MIGRMRGDLYLAKIKSLLIDKNIKTVKAAVKIYVNCNESGRGRKGN